MLDHDPVVIAPERLHSHAFLTLLDLDLFLPQKRDIRSLKPAFWSRFSRWSWSHIFKASQSAS